jgi:hypothetical protein
MAQEAAPCLVFCNRRMYPNEIALIQIYRFKVGRKIISTWEKQVKKKKKQKTKTKQLLHINKL